MPDRKIVINKCWGGFGLSRAALHELRKMKNKAAIAETDFGEKWPDTDKINDNKWHSYCREIDRDDPDLVTIVEKMGKDASSSLAHLVIVSIPDDVKWEIDDYDGMETVDEKHETWG